MGAGVNTWTSNGEEVLQQVLPLLGPCLSKDPQHCLEVILAGVRQFGTQEQALQLLGAALEQLCAPILSALQVGLL